jgi:predicted RNase H-like HicB family nuclease
MGIVAIHIVLPAYVAHEEDWHVARALNVEVTSQGRTVKEAVANLREALELYYEDQPAPDPIPTER